MGRWSTADSQKKSILLSDSKGPHNSTHFGLPFGYKYCGEFKYRCYSVGIPPTSATLIISILFHLPYHCSEWRRGNSNFRKHVCKYKYVIPLRNDCVSKCISMPRSVARSIRAFKTCPRLTTSLGRRHRKYAGRYVWWWLLPWCSGMFEGHAVQFPASLTLLLKISIWR